MTDQLILPNLDDNVAEYTVVKWLKQPGETVSENEPILEVETDKVTMEVMAELAGVVGKLMVQPGMVIQSGAVLAELQQVVSNGTPATTPRLTPVVARLVAEHQLDIHQIVGTGSKGRVTKKDVLAYLKQEKATQPAGQEVPIDTPKSVPAPPVAAPSALLSPSNVPGELLQLTGMRRSIAEHMVRSVHTSPHVTTIFEFDFSTVTAHRAAHKAAFAQDGIRLTYMAYLTYAAAHALKKFPLINSVWRETGIELKPEVNIGLITAVEGGLLAPVIRDADQRNLRGLAKSIGDLADQARSGTLKSTDLQGGTFSISNHGAAGSLLGTPIIFQPQAGILGIGAIEDRVKAINGGIHIRPCAYVSFSFDHRIMDGAVADGFVGEVKRVIENWS